MAKRVLVVEPNQWRADVLAKLLAGLGYEPVVHVSLFSEGIWEWVADPEIVGVLTYYIESTGPFARKCSELRDIVDMVRPGLPVLAISPTKTSGILYFEAIHFDIINDERALHELVREHLEGSCATCAQYRS